MAGPDDLANGQRFYFGVTDEAGKINLASLLKMDNGQGNIAYNVLMGPPNMTDQAANAARTVSRVAARHGDTEKTAKYAVSHGLRRGLKVKVDGETAQVSVRIPIVVPGFGDDRLRATRSATLPS